MKPLTLADRILAHLLSHPVPEGDAVGRSSEDADVRSTLSADAPPETTQDGIAAATGARVAHVSRALHQLVEKGLVSAHIARPRGGKRRARVHALTDSGRKLAV